MQSEYVPPRDDVENGVVRYEFHQRYEGEPALYHLRCDVCGPIYGCHEFDRSGTEREIHVRGTAHVNAMDIHKELLYTRELLNEATLALSNMRDTITFLRAVNAQYREQLEKLSGPLDKALEDLLGCEHDNDNE